MLGIILRISPIRDADAILTLLIQKVGKFSAYAFAYKKAASKFPNSLQLFHLYEFEISPNNKGLPTIRSAHSVQSFPNIPHSLEILSIGSCALESMDATLQEMLPAEPLIEQTLTLWETFNNDMDMPVQLALLCLRWFELQLLDHLGALPNLDYCAECAEHFTIAAEYLPAKGFICESCASQNMAGSPVPAHTILLFKKLLLQPLPLTLQNAQKNREHPETFDDSLALLTPIIRQAIHEHASRKVLKAHEFLRQLIPSEDKNMFL